MPPDPWNESALIELATREPIATLKATIQGIALLKRRGIVPSDDLRQSLLELPKYSGEALDGRSSLVGLQLIEAITASHAAISRVHRPITETASSPSMRKVSAQEVFNHVARHNPFFQRWLEFRDTRPARHPEEWDEFAVHDLPAFQHDYAMAMREFGQILMDFIRERRTLDPDIAYRLKHSHVFDGPESAIGLLAWLDIAEQEG